MSRVAGLTLVLLFFGCAAKSQQARPPEASPAASAAATDSEERRRYELVAPTPKSAPTATGPTSTGSPPSAPPADELPYDVPLELRKPLGKSSVAWANYLNEVHNRVHPLFADEFLATLKAFPADHPLNGELHTGLAVTLDPAQGAIESITVVRTSGVARFDEGAVTALRRAAPFGAAPDALLSEDSKVHFQWVLHRTEQYACSTYFMMPLLLRSSPAPAAN